MTLQKSTAKLSEKLMPDLNKLYDQIRTLGADLNAKIGRLESTVINQGFHAESELMSMTNLKECVESAADVVSTASTTLGPEGSERASVRYGSDFGDVFKKPSNEPMQRWMSSHTVYEFDDVEAPTQDPSEASTGEGFTVYESESDSDIEHELVRALFDNGKKRKEQGDLHGAERHLRNCLSRFPSTASYTSFASSQSSLATGVWKTELLELLTETYCMQGSWAQAKSTMKEKLAITERLTGKQSEHFLWDSFRLCEVLMNTKDYTEAQLHGRQALRGFRKLRGDGHTGYEKTLALLVQLCKEQGNLEDEEAYAALLGNHRANLKPADSLPALDTGVKKDAVSQSPDGEVQTHIQKESSGNGYRHGPHDSTSRAAASVDKGKQRKLTATARKGTRGDESLLDLPLGKVAEPESVGEQAVEIQKVKSSASNELSFPGQGKAPASETIGVVPTIASHANNGDTSSSTKLLLSLCHQELGKKPIFMIGRGREGYNCVVFADESRNQEIARATDYLTKEEARHAAALKTYKTLVTRSAHAVESPSERDASRKVPSVDMPDSATNMDSRTVLMASHTDPPAYTPIETPPLTSPTGFLQDIPEIMVSPTNVDTRFARPTPINTAQNIHVRRAASDSRLPSYKASTQTTAPDSDAVDPRKLADTHVNNNMPAHRRAASTSSRLPDWKGSNNLTLPQPAAGRAI